MTQKKHTPTYTAEFRARGVGLFKENRANYPSDNAAYKAIASKLGCSPDSLRAWCQQAERDAGIRNGLTSEDKARLKALERGRSRHCPMATFDAFSRNIRASSTLS